jgi:hypothetical protein
MTCGRSSRFFWELSYWKYLDVHHSIDVCESLIGTLLNTNGKTRDHLPARADLKEMGIRQEL